MRGFTVATIGGARIVLEPSLLVLAALLVVLFQGQFRQVAPGNSVFLSVIFVVFIIVSTFLHELGHLLMLRLFKLRVRSVSLNLLGGRTEVDQPYPAPFPLLLSAVVGPLISLALGGAAMFGASVTTGGTNALLWSLGVLNLLLAALNFLPGMPLDGGQAVRALVWMISRRDWLGLQVAGWSGRILDVGLVVWLLAGVRGFEPQDILRVFAAAVVGVTLWLGAGAAIREGRRMRRISRLVARELMAEGPAPDASPRISANLEGRMLLVALAENPADVYELVGEDGRAVGRLDAEAVDLKFRSSL